MQKTRTTLPNKTTPPQIRTPPKNDMVGMPTSRSQRTTIIIRAIINVCFEISAEDPDYVTKQTTSPKIKTTKKQKTTLSEIATVHERSHSGEAQPLDHSSFTPRV